MSDVQDVLKDINDDGVTNIDVPENIDDVVIGESEEEVSEDVVSTETNSNFLSSSKFSEEILNHITQLSYLTGMTKELSSIERIESKIAVEIFTMLPEYTGDNSANKLTSSPSIINKRLVEDVFKDSDSALNLSVKSELADKFQPIYSEFENFKIDDYDNLISYFQSLEVLLAEKYTYLKKSKHLLIYKEETLDILMTPLKVLVNISDSDMSYEKYKQELHKLVDNVIISLDDFVMCHKSANDSIETAVETAMKMCEYITSDVSRLEISFKEISDVTFYDDSKDDGAKLNIDQLHEISKFNIHVDMLLDLKKLVEVSKKENNVFDRLLKLISFID